MQQDEFMERVEKRRVGLGLSQAALAVRCGMSQGHYSKLAGGRVALGRKCRTRLAAWLKGEGGKRGMPPRADLIAEIAVLAGNMRTDFAKLLDLAERARM